MEEKNNIINLKKEIIPAILPMSFSDLEDKLSKVKGLANFVQIDVSDKSYTPEATWPYRKPDDNFKEIISEERGMPYWEDMDFEAHLMLKNPEEVTDDWILAGATRVLVHPNTTKNFYDYVNRFSNRIEVVPVIEINDNLETFVDLINKNIEKIKAVQCMGIERIGFQGMPFNERVLQTVKEIRLKFPELNISVDGGVGSENIKQILESGANRFVCGSDIFESENIVEEIHNLNNQINEHYRG